MMTRGLAYIAGPIQGFESKQEYRSTLAKILAQKGYDSVDPWKRESVLYSAEKGNLSKEEMAGFIRRDLSDIDRCDLFVAYLPRLSAGTCMELFHAKNLGKRTIVISMMEDLSPWIVYHSDILIKSIDELRKLLPMNGFSME